MIREPKEEKEIMRKHERDPDRSLRMRRVERQMRRESQPSFIYKKVSKDLPSVSSSQARKGYETELRTLRWCGCKNCTSLWWEIATTTGIPNFDFQGRVVTWPLALRSLYHRVWNGRERKEEKRGDTTFRHGNKEVLRITHIGNPAEDMKCHGF